MASPARVSACTLDGSELLARMHAWQQVTSRATSRRVEDTQIIATYPKDARLLQQLRELIAAEGACCSFLEFTLEEKANSVVTELRFPPETPTAARTLILEVIGASE
jgi:hypothetical protein